MLPKNVKIPAVISVIWFYALLTGMGPSVVRASVMGTVILLSMLFERDGNIYNSLALAALILLIWNPLNLWDVGFLLSFSATFSIVYLYPRIKEWLPPACMKYGLVRFFMDLFLVSLCATLGTLPIVIAVFNKLPVISLMANLLVVPLVGLLVSNGVIVLLFAAWFTAAADAFGTAAWALTCIIEKIVSVMAGIPHASISVATPGAWHYIFYIAGILCLAWIREKKWARKGLVFCIVLFLNLGVFSSLYNNLNNGLKILFFDVGQGDACLIEFPGGHRMLIDGGMRNIRKDYGERVILPYLRHAGIDRLDAAIVTHADADHLGGLVTVLEKVKTGMVMDPGCASQSGLYSEYLQLIEKKNIPRRIIKRGDMIEGFRECSLSVLHPDPCHMQRLDINDNSIVCLLVYKGQRILFTGDIGAEAEYLILEGQRQVRDIDLLKVPHHGSGTSSTRAWVQKLGPENCVVSVGTGNRFRHPDPQVISRYVQEGTSVLRTDFHGAVTAKVSANGTELSTMIQSPVPE
jgi:competence protein ComEC